MTCHHCGTTNRTGAAYCHHCGRLLIDVCPRCGSSAAPQANFCDTCGYPLSPQAWTGAWARPHDAATLSPRPATPEPTAVDASPILARSLEQFVPRELLAKLTAAQGAAAERRVVTMLFCDIQGSTTLAERLDPEEWTEIVNGAFEQMVNPIYKYEGTVARLMGDGLLAFFGAPVAHEDDPRRAVLAGLAIVDGIRAWRESLPVARDLAVRVGINTGLVVVGAVGSDLRLEYSAIGDAINMAARMEQTAAPGTVQISEETYRLVAGLFEVEPLGAIQAKGKAQPVNAYRVLRRATSPGRRSHTTHRAALVNRRMEWAAVERAFDSMSAGRGGLVFLIGEAGLGKTRLIDEAIERLLPDLAPDGRLYDVSAVSYESTQPYGLLARLMRRPLGLLPDDLPEKVRARITEAIAGDGEYQVDHRVLEMLFGINGSPAGTEISAEQFTHQLNVCLKRFFRGQAASPLVIAIDELQWLDASSADCLAALFALTETAPILFICALRRERQSAGWRLMETTGRELPHRLAEVVLHPLSDGESRQLLARLLDATDLPDHLTTLILEKAEGNPLFLEEVVRHLMERGVLSRGENGQWQAAAQADIRLPDSLLALLTARIDRLDEATRRTLQVAAVIGRQFARSTLAALVDDPEALDRHLSQLQRMELVMETRRLPELIYTFHHNLIQEAVYNTILLRQRRALHLRVADALAAGPEANLGAMASMLAHHLIEGDAPERALPHLLLAASNALRLHAPAEAIAHYQRALPIALKHPGDSTFLVEFLNNYGRAYELQSRFAEAKALYEEFEQRALARGDKALELASLIAQGKLYSNVTPYYDAVHGRRLMERAMELAEETGNQAAEVRILWNLVNIDRFDIDALKKAVANGERGVALARKLGLKEDLAYLLNDMGDIYATAGLFEQSAQSLEEARRLWRELANEAMLADSLSSTALWESVFGRQETARDFAEEAIDISLRLGNIWGEAYSKGVHGNILATLGDYGRALVELQETIHKAEIAGFIGGQVIGNSYMSRIYLEAGDSGRAISAAREGAEIGRKHLPQFAGMCIGRQALGHIAAGDVTAAATLMDDPLAANRGQQVFVRYDLSLARVNLTLANGRYDEAAAQADEFIDYFGRIHSESWRMSFHEAKARALIALGRPEEAAVQLAQATGLARAHGLRSILWRYLVAAAEVEEMLGRHDDVASLWAEAAAELNYLIPKWPDDLRPLFLARPQVSRIRAAQQTHSTQP